MGTRSERSAESREDKSDLDRSASPTRVRNNPESDEIIKGCHCSEKKEDCKYCDSCRRMADQSCISCGKGSEQSREAMGNG